MKILMTGFTPRGVNSQKVLYSYMSNTAVLKRALEMGGHEVDHRIVDVEEPGLTSRYDIAMVALAVPQSLSSRYVYGALWAASQFGEARTRYFVDDWLLHQFKSQLEAGIRNPEKRFYSLDNRHGYELAKKHTELWLQMFKHLAYGKYRLLMPAFPWSKPTVLLPKLSNITPVIFDPTPAALEFPDALCGATEPVMLCPAEPADRQRRWTLAAMRDISAWFPKQKFSWPVDQYGNKRQGQEILDEVDLLQRVYCKSWGIIGAPYGAVARGGGWRVRYIHAALTKSILYLDWDEAETAGRPYMLYKNTIESASTDQLVDIAEAQRHHLMTKCWTMDQLIGAAHNYVQMP